MKLKYPFNILQWAPKNMHDSILPIMILNWIVGLSIWEYPLGKPRPVLTFIYVLGANSFYWYLLMNSQDGMEIENLTNTGKTIFALIVGFNLIIAVSSIIIGWYYYQTLKSIIKRFEHLDLAFEVLGLPKNYRKVFSNTMLKAAMWVIIIVVLVITDLNILQPQFSLLKSLHLIYVFQCPLYVNAVVDFTFTSLVNIIGIKFESINVLLKKHLRKKPEPETVRDLYLKYSRVRSLAISREDIVRLKEKRLEKHLLIISRYLHMELSNISWKVNTIFQKQMMMEVGAYVFILTGLLYKLFFNIFFYEKKLNFHISQLYHGAIWITVYAYKIFNITSNCAKVSQEAQKTKGILCDLKSINEDEELEEEIEQFSLQLAQRPLEFSACGLSTLDYPLVQKFIGTVTTYLVILIQFSPQISK